MYTNSYLLQAVENEKQEQVCICNLNFFQQNNFVLTYGKLIYILYCGRMRNWRSS